MTYDPLSEVIDEPLHVDAEVIATLVKFRSQPKLLLLPGVDPTLERERLSKVIDDLLDILVVRIEDNPSKMWALTQFQHALVQVQMEDTEGREHFGSEVEHIMDILGIESSDGVLSFYLGGLLCASKSSRPTRQSTSFPSVTGRCAIKPRSAGHFYVGPRKIVDSWPAPA